MKFYNNAMSPNAARVRRVAAEVGLNLANVELDFAKGEHKTPEYMAKNPMGKIPTFEDADGFTLWESPAICLYLAEKAGKLMPTSLKDRAEANRWMFWNASHYEPIAYSVLFEKMIKPGMMKQPTDETVVAAKTKDHERFVAVLNGHLEGKEWLLGNTLSVADFVVGNTVAAAKMVGLALPTHVNAWLSRLEARPSWNK